MIVLNELEKSGLIPECVVTTPDKPKGRKLALTPTEVKVWAQMRKIKVYEPAKLDESFAREIANENCQVFIVASYGKIIPGMIIDLPKHRTLNIHPSLLPRYRGATPLQSVMIDDAKETGVSVMRIDEAMDHGPIIAQEKVSVNKWPAYEEFEAMMAKVGGRLLARILPEWLAGKIEEREQAHDQATYTKKIAKEDGLIDLTGDPYLNFRKIQAYHEWPQAYFFIARKKTDRPEHNGSDETATAETKIRVKITAASFKDGKLTIEKVVPEGSREMAWDDFVRGYRLTAPKPLS